MRGLRVSEVAARAGVPPSTVRFYERTGLLPAARRAMNGYRVFDETAVDDLSLIARAKDIGMSLDDIAQLVAIWRTGSCLSLQARLRSHLSAKIAQTRAHTADLRATRRRLEEALAVLTAQDTGPEAKTDSARCGTRCECDTALAAKPGKADSAGDVIPGCSLGPDDLADRLAQWRRLAETAISTQREGDISRLILDPAAIPAATKLLAAEATCCPQGSFTLHLSAGQVTLTAEIPGLRHAVP